MSVVHLWGRQVKEARTTVDRLVEQTRTLESDVSRKADEVNRAARTTQNAAVAILESNDQYLRAAVHRRR